MRNQKHDRVYSQRAPSDFVDLKKESREDEFILSIKNKIHNKDPHMPEVFSLCDNVQLYNERVVISNSLQRKILRDFLIGHPGKNRTKSLMCCKHGQGHNRHDKNPCKGCTLAAKSPTTTCKPWPKIDHPWERIHADFAGPVDNMYYLIVVDSPSKWPEVLQCKRPTTNCTIKFLHELFARFGVVDCVVTDNGTQVNTQDVSSRLFLQRLNITPGRMVRPRGLWAP